MSKSSQMMDNITFTSNNFMIDNQLRVYKG